MFGGKFQGVFAAWTLRIYSVVCVAFPFHQRNWQDLPELGLCSAWMEGKELHPLSNQDAFIQEMRDAKEKAG